jgi:hypothetical protein
MTDTCTQSDLANINQYLSKNCKPDGSNYAQVCALAQKMYGRGCPCDNDQSRCPSAPSPPSPSKDGKAGFQQCKSKAGTGICNETAIESCCASYCGNDSACLYDCDADARNFCSGESCTSDSTCQNGLKCISGMCQTPAPDRGPKLGDSCCRYDATNSSCEQVGTCYQNECASPDKCFIKDSECSACNSSIGGGGGGGKENGGGGGKGNGGGGKGNGGGGSGSGNGGVGDTCKVDNDCASGYECYGGKCKSKDDYTSVVLFVGGIFALAIIGSIIYVISTSKKTSKRKR